jgi:hypothetical protein
MTEENVDIDRVMGRIQKLLAIANDDRANPNEAAAAAHQAEKLMRKYQLAHADIVRRDLERNDSMTVEHVRAVMKRGTTHKINKRNPVWAGQIALQVAIYNGVRCFSGETGGSACFSFAGYKHDVTVAVWMFNFLIDVTIKNVRAFQKEAHRTKVQSEDYRRGFVAAVYGQLQAAIEIKEQEQRDEAAANSTGRELMIIKSDAVTKRFGEQGQRQHKGKEVDPTFFGRGLQDGRKVDATRRAVETDGNATLALQ